MKGNFFFFSQKKINFAQKRFINYNIKEKNKLYTQ